MENKVCLITGALGGVGACTAMRFAADGYKIVLADIPAEEKAIALLEQLGGPENAIYVKTDVTDENKCKEAVEAAVNAFGHIDVLINNAGVNEHKTFWDGDIAEIERVFNVNFFGAVNMAQVAAREMILEKNEKGVIVNVTSMCARIVHDDTIGYHASKAALERSTEVLAYELAPYGIRCVAIAPGWVHTNMVLPEMVEAGGELHMHGRIIEPEEIAEIIRFAADERAYAFNGSQIMADDGLCSFKTISGDKRAEE